MTLLPLNLLNLHKSVFRCLIIFFLFSLHYSLYSQKAINSGSRVSRYNSSETFQKTIKTNSTALVLKSEFDLGQFVEVQINGRTQPIPLDPDADSYTYFISVGFEIQTVKVDVSAAYELYLINSGKVPQFQEQAQSEWRKDCEFVVNAVPQSEWRSGLAAPSFTRSFTDVSHLIVHHSAGSNTNTNYTQVVRDIYLYHTEVNGWSDIGYNYLIAQNGVIYTGRDPANGEQDNVRGAHFCGANSNTMGICLLGNYQSAELSMPAFSSLTSILAFKTNKEGIDPLASSQHTQGVIPNIAGHRDGCATLCPGENVYQLLGTIRTSVSDDLEDCGDGNFSLDFTASNLNPELKEAVQFENLSIGYDQYRWYFEDATTDSTFWEAGGFCQFVTSGPKDVAIIGTTENRQDTLVRKDFITVNQVGIFPTLITGYNEVIYLPQNDVISGVALLSMNGQRIDFSNPTSSQYILPPGLPNGLYSLKATVAGQAKTYRILVRR